VYLLLWSPRTGEPEVNSYLDEGSVRLGGGCSSPPESRLRTSVVTLVDADVGYYLVGVAVFVCGQAVGVTHRDHAVEIGDPMWISVEAVEASSNARKELIKKKGWGG